MVYLIVGIASAAFWWVMGEVLRQKERRQTVAFAIAAVPRLRACAKDIYIELDVREAVLDAVKALQGRVAVEHGGLSVPDDDGGGQLAIAEDAAGRLSATK